MPASDDVIVLLTRLTPSLVVAPISVAAKISQARAKSS